MTDNDVTKRLFRKLVIWHLKILRLTTRVLPFYQEEKGVDVLLIADSLEDILDRIDDLLDEKGNGDALLNEFLKIKKFGGTLSGIEKDCNQLERVLLSWFGESIRDSAVIAYKSMEKI